MEACNSQCEMIQNADVPSLEERNVYYSPVVISKLEQIHLERERILPLTLVFPGFYNIHHKRFTSDKAGDGMQR